MVRQQHLELLGAQEQQEQEELGLQLVLREQVRHLDQLVELLVQLVHAETFGRHDIFPILIRALRQLVLLLERLLVQEMLSSLMLGQMFLVKALGVLLGRRLFLLMLVLFLFEKAHLQE